MFEKFEDWHIKNPYELDGIIQAKQSNLSAEMGKGNQHTICLSGL